MKTKTTFSKRQVCNTLRADLTNSLRPLIGHKQSVCIRVNTHGRGKRKLSGAAIPIKQTRNANPSIGGHQTCTTRHKSVKRQIMTHCVGGNNHLG